MDNPAIPAQKLNQERLVQSKFLPDFCNLFSG